MEEQGEGEYEWQVYLQLQLIVYLIHHHHHPAAVGVQEGCGLHACAVRVGVAAATTQVHRPLPQIPAAHTKHDTGYVVRVRVVITPTP